MIPAPSPNIHTTTAPAPRPLLPLLLVTSLFFLWGLAYGLLDVLNKHFQDSLGITKQRSTLLQAAYFGAYFLMALPVGWAMQRWGYRRSIIGGLLLYATGALLFLPAALAASFPLFLAALFVLASGLTFLETAANPYMTILGSQAAAAFRLNLAQSFNGVGSFLGPLLGAAFFFGQGPKQAGLQSVQWVYVGIALLVLAVALLFFKTPMPEAKETASAEQGVSKAGLWQKPQFVGAVAAQFFYVAAQVGIAALFINYCTEQSLAIDSEQAAYLLSGSLLLFTLGRFAGTALLRWVAPARLLAGYALASMALCALVVWGHGWLSVYALMAVFFFESIMFPTIFALGVQGAGTAIKRAASFLVMSIVGGALMPVVMGSLAETYSTAWAYAVPIACFSVVFLFALRAPSSSKK